MRNFPRDSILLFCLCIDVKNGSKKKYIRIILRNHLTVKVRFIISAFFNMSRDSFQPQIFSICILPSRLRLYHGEMDARIVFYCQNLLF